VDIPLFTDPCFADQSAIVNRLLSGMFIVAGIVIELTTIDVISIDENLVHAPDWILGLCGLLFLSGGLAIVASPKSSIATWSAGTLVIFMTLISAWVAVYGASEHFSGDLPLLSRDSNVIIARIIFWCVSLLGLAITTAAIKKTWIDRV
jgi:hypothetical protein